MRERDADTPGLRPDAAVPESECGNRRLEPGEACDGGNFGGASCRSLGFAGGVLACGPGCEVDTRGCREAQPPPEPPADICRRPLPDSSLSERCLTQLCQCDPGAFSACGEECFAVLECVVRFCPQRPVDPGCVIRNCAEHFQAVPDASAFGSCFGQSSACFSDVPPSCGNGRRNAGEQCDGKDFGAESCRSLGHGSGALRCTADCRYAFGACNDDARCGDGAVDPDEQCDGSALQGHSCEELGFTGGTLACEECRLDTSDCHRCGDERVQASERCDGDDLGGLSCHRLGFAGGTLACDATCQHDTSGCAACGNGTVETGEACDGAELGGLDCAALGLGSGVLACHPEACLFDVSGCSEAQPGVCGNAVAEPGEQCDDDDVTGLSCLDLGYDEGTLLCNGATCRFDTSQCGFTAQPEPGEDCGDCSQRACGEIAAACEADALCVGGLDCLAQRCGATGGLDCARDCFTDLDSAVRAVSMFGCVTSACGPSCVGL